MRKIINLVVIMLLFTSVSYSQEISESNFVQFCESIEAKSSLTKNLIDELQEIEEATQYTWFVRSSIVDFYTELNELKSHCKVLDLIDIEKFGTFFERVSKDYKDKIEKNGSILEQIITLEGKLGDEKLNRLIKQVIEYRKEFYK